MNDRTLPSSAEDDDQPEVYTEDRRGTGLNEEIPKQKREREREGNEKENNGKRVLYRGVGREIDISRGFNDIRPAKRIDKDTHHEIDRSFFAIRKNAFAFFFRRLFLLVYRVNASLTSLDPLQSLFVSAFSFVFFLPSVACYFLS